MIDLSLSCISWKLAAERTTLATEGLIFELLNNPSYASTIGGVKPMSGPVVDDATESDSNQVRDRNVGVDVAQCIITKRNSLGAPASLRFSCGANHLC